VTGLQRHFTAAQQESLAAAEAAGVFTYKTVAQGAATSVVAAVAPQFARTGGHYLDDAQEAYTVPDADDADHPHGVQEWALNPATAVTTAMTIPRPRGPLAQLPVSSFMTLAPQWTRVPAPIMAPRERKRP
jgi:hypothetical protein